jgi:hypothetical protein
MNPRRQVLHRNGSSCARHRRKLVLESRMVMAWWSGIGVEVDAIVDDGIEEMVDGELVDEEEDTVDISSIRSLAILPCKMDGSG